MVWEHQDYFLSQENNPEWIKQWWDAVIQASKTLSIFPFRYRIVRDDIRRIKLNTKYSILYRVDEDSLIVYVLGCVHMWWQLSEFFDRIEQENTEDES